VCRETLCDALRRNPTTLACRSLTTASVNAELGDERRVSPEQTLTRAEALRCATHNNAFLTFDEDRKGSLEPGKLADMAVLSADPLTVEEVGIRDVKSLMTMVGGKIVYETPNWFG
jgi:predicted amidohydrolase YtcJ